MEIPKYDKHDLEAVTMTGEYALTEFDQYIQELKSSDMLSNSAAIGVVSRVADQGTATLSDAQLKVLELTAKQFPVEHCIRCSEVIVVKAGKNPVFVRAAETLLKPSNYRLTVK